jgi:hypothetical protein
MGGIFRSVDVATYRIGITSSKRSVCRLSVAASNFVEHVAGQRARNSGRQDSVHCDGASWGPYHDTKGRRHRFDAGGVDQLAVTATSVERWTEVTERESTIVSSVPGWEGIR